MYSGTTEGVDEEVDDDNDNEDDDDADFNDEDDDDVDEGLQQAIENSIISLEAEDQGAAPPIELSTPKVSTLNSFFSQIN